MARGLSDLQKRILEIAFETFCGDPEIPASDDTTAPRLSTEQLKQRWAAIFNDEPVDESLVSAKWGIEHVEIRWVAAEILGVDYERDSWGVRFRCDDKYPGQAGRQRYEHGVNVKSRNYHKAMSAVSRSLKRLRERGLLTQQRKGSGELTTKGVAVCIELFEQQPPRRAWNRNVTA